MNHPRHAVSVRRPTFSAVYVAAGSVRRVWFESETEETAKVFALAHHFGLEGPGAGPTGAPATPAAYDERTARGLLGNISRSTLYREVLKGRLDRVPGTQKVLITRLSLERWGR